MDQLELLRLFLAIADQGSLSAVARSRAISPSTVSLALQKLEARVGAPLVTRTTRRLSLTADGERFAADCRRILGELDEVLDGVASDGPLTGQLRVTCTNDFGRQRLAPLVDTFMRLHPGLRVELWLSDSIIDLAEEGLDLGIRTGPLRDSRLTARLLVRGRHCVVASPAYWARAGRPAHPRDLQQHNCLVLARPGALLSNWRFLEAGQIFTVKVDGDRRTTDGGMLRAWAVAGAGVVMKSSWDAHEDLQAGRLEPVLDDFGVTDMNLYAVYPAGRQAPRRTRAFVDFLADALA
ncbi:LysR family transcriptional regulator [Bordetella genomosp. 1]|uniref:LysR family transcriptional regulator n=1 Tax=Bordetella genomosp. 1 TaxID=1395607 RepID=A0ABX4EYJ9_9BORD|nr:LysR family transcriptional regulator [Bordetella genomosp. 1]OZI64176.1 LysR family transcriptional regulator [Bordetella genomosp. 1]